MSGTFARVARGGGIMHLGSSRFSSLPFPLPPADVQVRIADEVDRRTVELRRAEESLTSALHHLDDQVYEVLNAVVDGTITRSSEPTLDTQAAYISNNIELDQALNYGLIAAASGDFPDLAQFPWAANIPNGWAWVRMDQIAEIKVGREKSPKRAIGEYMRPYLRVANVLEDRIDATEILEMNFTPEEYETYALKAGDVLLNEGQSPELVGRPAVYHGEVPGACYQNHIMRFRSAGGVDPEYAVLVFRSYLHTGKFQAIARWTTNLATLSVKRFSAMPFPLPPLHIQQQIVAAARRQLDEAEEQSASVKAALERLPESRTRNSKQSSSRNLGGQYQ